MEKITNPKDCRVGDEINFLCNGAGRGGHYRVWAVVTKINRKTVAATECSRSYKPGTLWSVSVNTEYPVFRAAR